MVRVPEAQSDHYWARQSRAIVFPLPLHVVLKSSIHSLASPRTEAVWLAFWNSDHVVLKSSIHTLALPRQQWSDWGLRVAKNEYFSLIAHTKQLLLVTFCDTTAGIWVIFWTHRRTAAEAPTIVPLQSFIMFMFQRPNQTATEPGKAKVCILDFKIT